jgi:NAD(P)-dependent dehydrogenase (short-subunit alcohol dehydrogenase family)
MDDRVLAHYEAQSAGFDLTGRVALVTGASRGIGEAVALTLAKHGAHVIVSARKPEGCAAVAEAIRMGGGSASALPCHIGEMDDILHTFATIRSTHGHLDILVNNAATNPYYGPIEDTDLGAFQKTLDVNIRGYFYMSAEAVKLMKRNGGGAIVNVASINGVVPGLMQGIYSITKSAVIGMTKAFARECAPMGIRVNALLPGLTETRLAGALLAPENRGKWEAAIPMQRPAQPSEMAGAVLYLVSPAASYTTGSALTVDGGFLVT